MPHKVFIDGAEGTTGLEIRERLAQRSEFDLLVLDEELRKDTGARRDALNDADFAILCLPDAAARDAAAMVGDGPNVRIIDASSAHRTADGWTYGFPELTGADRMAAAPRVSNPGCYATGFLALVAPLVRAGALPADWPYTAHAVSGYSGGGKGLIARFEAEPDLAWRGYGYDLAHKHRPEMKRHAGLAHDVIFSPSVVPAFRGMVVEIPLHLGAMPGEPTAPQLREAMTQFYAGSPLVTVADGAAPDELLLHRNAEPDDGMQLYVLGNQGGGHARLIARLDNLGKGASGQAVQNLNLMAGLDQTAGLRLPNR